MIIVASWVEYAQQAIVVGAQIAAIGSLDWQKVVWVKFDAEIQRNVSRDKNIVIGSHGPVLPIGPLGMKMNIHFVPWWFTG